MNACWKLLILAPALCLSALLGVTPVVARADTGASSVKPEKARLPRIVILATGGTIAGQSDERSAIGYNAAKLDPRQLILAAPGIEKLARLSTEQVASVASQNMTEVIWQALATRIRELFARNEADGIVITHGTDTVEETAFFLDLVLAEDSPVVLVGAMRPATALSADGPANLYAAVRVAASPAARERGVLVVLNETIHGARGVQKISANAQPSFASPNWGPTGHVDADNLRFETSVPAPARTHDYAHALSIPLPRVDIVYAHAQMDGLPIDDAIKRGCRGLVIAGVGAGNLSDSALAAAKRAAERGVVIVRSSRTGSGFVERNVEVDDDRLGFIASRDLNPQKARVLLQVLLANQVTASAAIQQAFDGS